MFVIIQDWIKEEKEMKEYQQSLEEKDEKKKWWNKALKYGKNFVEYVIE